MRRSQWTCPQGGHLLKGRKKWVSTSRKRDGSFNHPKWTACLRARLIFLMVVSYYTCFCSDHYMRPKIILTWLAPSCHSNLNLNVPKCLHLMWPWSLPIPLSSLIVPMAFSCAWPFLVLFNCPLLGVDCLTTPVLRPWAGTGSSRSVAQMNK